MSDEQNPKTTRKRPAAKPKATATGGYQPKATEKPMPAPPAGRKGRGNAKAPDNLASAAQSLHDRGTKESAVPPRPQVKTKSVGGFTVSGEEGSFFDPDKWEEVPVGNRDSKSPRGEFTQKPKTSHRQKIDPSEIPPDEPEIRDVKTGGRHPPAEFREPEFARIFLGLFDEYATYRAYGISSEKAFLRVFGTGYADLWLTDRIEALEHNTVFRAIFARKFESIKVGEMWSLKQSVFELLSIVNHPYLKENVRFAALKELNVIYGITMIDEQGRSTRGKSLQDFYRENVPNSPVVAQTIAAHPEPGSPEADAFLKTNAPATRET